MDTEDDARYPRIAYGNQSYGSSSRQKLTGRNTSAFTHNGNARYVEVNDIDEDDENVEDEEDEDHEENGVRRLSYEDEDDEEDDYGDMQRHPKKRKLKSLLSSYEFAPRVPPPSVAPPAATVPKSAFGGRNSVADWSEHETFILLDAWGDKFLQHGRKSLRSEEWHDVAEKVSQDSKIDRTDTQCRNRLDTLKKKYKKEKAKLAGSGGSLVSRWVYFKKMDTLMCSQPQQSGLSCGVDSGEYVFMNPKDYLNRANGLDEMRDSPGNSESAEGNEDDDDDEEEEDEEDSEGLPPRKNKKKNQEGNGISFKLLADSIQKFSDIYEKIENSKRQQMLELEQMRMDFHRDLELQKRQILERAQAEIAKIREGDDDDDDDDDQGQDEDDQDDEEQNDDDVSVENTSG